MRASVYPKSQMDCSTEYKWQFDLVENRVPTLNQQYQQGDRSYEAVWKSLPTNDKKPLDDEGAFTHTMLDSLNNNTFPLQP
jgi:hypothetical protein